MTTHCEIQTTDEKTLVTRAAQGDHEAFAQLVHRHYDRAVRVALGIVKNRDEAEDVVQDAFLRVHCRLPNFEGAAAFYTWMYRIVVNVSIDSVRRRRRQRCVDVEVEERGDVTSNEQELWPRPPTGNPTFNVEQSELRNNILNAFARLPEIHRAVIVLREVEGQTYEEIAETLSLKKGTVMSRLFHARRSMQRHLEALDNDETGRVCRLSHGSFAKQRTSHQHEHRAVA